MSEETKTAYYGQLPQKFTQTQWTSIVRPAGAGDMEALDLLARAYWYPLFWHTRRSGMGEHDAEDLVQSFLAVFIASGGVEKADPQRGKFRTFLLTALKRFRISEWRKTKNAVPATSLDGLVEEKGDAQLPSVEDNHDADFYRDWAITLLNLALQRLEEEQVALGRGDLFGHLKEHLHRGNNLAGLSEQIGIKENTLKSDLRRLRKEHLPRLLAEEVRRTLCDPTDDEVNQELHFIKQYATGGVAA